MVVGGDDEEGCGCAAVIGYLFFVIRAASGRVIRYGCSLLGLPLAELFVICCSLLVLRITFNS